VALSYAQKRGSSEGIIPRPASWFPRLYDITPSVTNSVRSHLDRRDLESLFELQPRAAQESSRCCPPREVGTSHLVSRESLLTLFGRVREAQNTALLFERLRRKKTSAPRRKIRSLVRTDLAAHSPTSLPDSITMGRGRLKVCFQTIEELAEDLMRIARLLAEEGESFARSYEPEKPPKPDDEADDFQRMFEELEGMESAANSRTGEAVTIRGRLPLSPVSDSAAVFRHPLCGDTPQRPGHRAAHPSGRLRRPSHNTSCSA